MEQLQGGQALGRGEAREECCLKMGAGRGQRWVHNHVSLDTRI